MSNRNNDVFQVLVTSGNLALATAGTAYDALAVGQLGAFNPETNLAYGATAAAGTKNIVFAVGVDKTGSGNLEDIRTSAGQFIQTKGITDLTFQPHTAGQAMKVNVGNYKADAETEYGIRIEFRNAKINRIQGYNQFSKAFLVKTPATADCTTGCGSTDANVLTQLFIEAINADQSKLVLAQAIARQPIVILTHGTTAAYSTGDVMSAADVARLIVFNSTALPAAEVFADIQLVSQPLAIGSYCSVNLHYYKLLETVLIVSLIEGFGGSGATTINQYPVYEEGSGVNIQQKEYHASGWAGSGPYKLSQVTGTAYENIQYLASKTAKYDQFIVQYNQTSEAGWQEYSNTLSTVIAIPEASTVTRQAVATFFNSFLSTSGFETLVDDAAAANVSPTAVEVVVADVTLDGIS
jgi:hypothetical protein